MSILVQETKVRAVFQAGARLGVEIKASRTYIFPNWLALALASDIVEVETRDSCVG